MLKNKLHIYGEEEVEVPAHCNYGREMMSRILKYKDNIAMINGATGEIMTYAELAQQVVDVALSLEHMGVKKGDVISISSERRMEIQPTVLGSVCAGAIYSPIDFTSGEVTFRHRLEIAKPSVMFCSHNAYTRHGALIHSVGYVRTIILYDEETPHDGQHDNVTTFREFLTHTAPVSDFMPVAVDGWTDKMFIAYSNGTTGLPKGIPMTHLNFLVISRTVAKEELYHGSTVLTTREWCYSYGMQHSLACLYVGSTLIISSSRNEDMFSAIEKYKTKILQICPMTINQMVKAEDSDKYDLSSVQYIISTSTPCRRELVEAAEKMFLNLRSVVQLYGTTEAGCVCSVERAPFGPRAGSVGCAQPSTVFKVVDLETREPLGPNQRGEICFKALTVMKGYMDNPDDRSWLDEEGFYKSGDAGYYDEDRYFYIADRLKELIKMYSYSVAPAEYEAILLTHPAVLETGVIGVPHEVMGEVPLAMVALRPGATASEDELVKHVNKQMPDKKPLAGGVRFVDRLPRVGGSKIDKKALKLMI